jgi:hypothetical protein
MASLTQDNPVCCFFFLAHAGVKNMKLWDYFMAKALENNIDMYYYFHIPEQIPTNARYKKIPYDSKSSWNDIKLIQIINTCEKFIVNEHIGKKGVIYMVSGNDIPVRHPKRVIYETQMCIGLGDGDDYETWAKQRRGRRLNKYLKYNDYLFREKHAFDNILYEGDIFNWVEGITWHAITFEDVLFLNKDSAYDKWMNNLHTIFSRVYHKLDEAYDRLKWVQKNKKRNIYDHMVPAIPESHPQTFYTRKTMVEKGEEYFKKKWPYLTICTAFDWRNDKGLYSPPLWKDPDGNDSTEYINILSRFYANFNIYGILALTVFLSTMSGDNAMSFRKVDEICETNVDFYNFGTKLIDEIEIRNVVNTLASKYSYFDNSDTQKIFLFTNKKPFVDDLTLLFNKMMGFDANTCKQTFIIDLMSSTVFHRDMWNKQTKDTANSKRVTNWEPIVNPKYSIKF